jgi:hypothetical protein
MSDEVEGTKPRFSGSRSPIGHRTASSSRYRERIRQDALPGLPSPDVWSRRWVIGCAIALVVGTLLPIPDFVSRRGRASEGVSLLWPWTAVGRGTIGWVDLAATLVLATFALLTLRWKGAIRGMALFVGTLALQIVGSFVTASGSGATVFDKGFRGDTMAVGLLLASMVIFGLLGVAVGNHVRKRSPASSAAMTVSGVGGVLLVLIFFLPFAGSPMFGVFFEARAWDAAWSVMLLLLLVFVFALLGLRSFSSSGVPSRCFLTSLVARLLLFGYPFALAVMLAKTFTFGSALVFCLRLGLLFAGAFGLIATGLAAWIEGSIVARNPPPLDAKQAADAFA